MGKQSIQIDSNSSDVYLDNFRKALNVEFKKQLLNVKNINLVSDLLSTKKINVALISSTKEKKLDLLQIAKKTNNASGRWIIIGTNLSEELQAVIEGEKMNYQCIGDAGDAENIETVEFAISRFIYGYKNKAQKKTIPEPPVTKDEKKQNQAIKIPVFLAIKYIFTFLLTLSISIVCIYSAYTYSLKCISKSFSSDKGVNYLCLNTGIQLGKLVGLFYKSPLSPLLVAAKEFYDSGNILTSTIAIGLENVLNGKPSNDIVSSLENIVSVSEARLQVLQNESSFIASETYIYKNDLEQLSKIIQSTKSKLAGIHYFLPSISKLAKMKSSNILVVFQDSEELRATGGKIMSMSLVNLSDNQIKEIQTMSASELGSSLYGSVVASSDYQLATGNKELYPEDSNWEADATASLNKIAWFVEKDKDIKVDLVIAVNGEFLKRLLKIYGPVTTTSFGEISAESFREHLQSAEKENGDSEKFFTDTVTALTPKFKFTNFESSRELLKQTLLGLENNEFIFSFSDQKGDINNWSKKIVMENCLAFPKCRNIYAYIIDSNVGLTKTDAKVEKKQKITHQIDTNQITTQISLDYKNNSASAKYPSGNYRDYIRVYLPSYSQVESLKINDREISPDNYSLSSEYGLTVVGFLNEIGPQKNSKVELNTIQHIAKLDGKTKLIFENPEQSGRILTSKSVSIKFNPLWFINTYSRPQIAKVDELEYNSLSAAKIVIDASP